MTERQRPITTVRAGPVQIAVWQNEHEGRPIYNTTIERLYRDDEGNWRPASSFGRDDLLLLGQATTKAFWAIQELQAKDREQQRETESQSQPAAAHAQGGGR